MTGIQFLTDDKGRKVAVQIDPLPRLQALPATGQWIAVQHDKDAAWCQVTTQLDRLVARLSIEAGTSA